MCTGRGRAFDSRRELIAAGVMLFAEIVFTIYYELLGNVVDSSAEIIRLK